MKSLVAIAIAGLILATPSRANEFCRTLLATIDDVPDFKQISSGHVPWLRGAGPHVAPLQSCGFYDNRSAGFQAYYVCTFARVEWHSFAVKIHSYRPIADRITGCLTKAGRAFAFEGLRRLDPRREELLKISTSHAFVSISLVPATDAGPMMIYWLSVYEKPA
jgi:hypothetical protein